MAYLDDIENQYKKMFLAKQNEALQKKNQDLADLDTQQSGLTNQYTDLIKGYQNKQQQAKEGFYQDRNNVAAGNAQNVQRIRDYMAKNNLMSSGENVDAMLRTNTDYNNNLGNVYNAEKQSDNYYTGQVDSAEREKAQKISDIMNKMRLVNDNYSSGLQAYQDDLDAKKMSDINAYNEQLRREEVQRQQQERQFQQQLTMQRASAARSGSSSAYKAQQAQDKQLRTDYNGALDDIMKMKSAARRKKVGEDESGQAMYDYIPTYSDEDIINYATNLNLPDEYVVKILNAAGVKKPAARSTSSYPVIGSMAGAYLGR